MTERVESFVSTEFGDPLSITFVNTVVATNLNANSSGTDSRFTEMVSDIQPPSRAVIAQIITSNLPSSNTQPSGSVVTSNPVGSSRNVAIIDVLSEDLLQGTVVQESSTALSRRRTHIGSSSSIMAPSNKSRSQADKFRTITPASQQPLSASSSIPGSLFVSSSIYLPPSQQNIASSLVTSITNSCIQRLFSGLNYPISK